MALVSPWCTDLQGVPIVHWVPNQQAGWNNIRWLGLPTPTMGDDTFSHVQHSLIDALQQCPWKNKVCHWVPEWGIEEALCMPKLSASRTTTSMQYSTGFYCATQYRYPMQSAPQWHRWSSRALCSCCWSRPTCGCSSLCEAEWSCNVLLMLLSTITFEGWSQKMPFLLNIFLFNQNDIVWHNGCWDIYEHKLILIHCSERYARGHCKCDKNKWKCINQESYKWCIISIYKLCHLIYIEIYLYIFN